MAVRTITTSIILDGEQEFKKQMASVNSEMKNLKSDMALATAEFKGQANSMEALTSKGKILQQQYDQQAEKVKALEKAVADSSEAFGDADKRTDDYKRQLNYAKIALQDLNDAIQKNEQYLDEAKRSADHAADSIDEYGREIKDAGEKARAAGEDIGGPLDGIDSFVGKLGGLKGALAGGAIVGGISAITGAITDLVDETEEYRKVMGTLESSSQAAGYTAEETAETYGKLQGVLGDTQTAATTAANLQAIGLEQEQLMTITEQTIGAWAKYGDSIPIDGLAEAVNETIKAGTVTGTFADVLNWGSAEGETFGVKLRESTEANKEWNEAVANCSTAEDYFNLALSECTTTAERADLVQQAMARQGLAEMATAWKKNNEDIVKTHEAQARYEEAQAGLAERLLPVKTALTDLATGGFDVMASAIDGAKDAIKDLGDWWEKTRPKLENGWNKFFGTTSHDVEAAKNRWKPITYDPGLGMSGFNAGGLDRVPYDGYISYNHKDESILTADEAAVWRSIKRVAGGSASSADARSTGGVETDPSQLLAAVAASGSQQDIVLNVTMDLDGDVLARKQLRYNARQKTFAGDSMIDGGV